MAPLARHSNWLLRAPGQPDFIQCPSRATQPGQSRLLGYSLGSPDRRGLVRREAAPRDAGKRSCSSPPSQSQLAPYPGPQRARLESEDWSRTPWPEEPVLMQAEGLPPRPPGLWGPCAPSLGARLGPEDCLCTRPAGSWPWSPEAPRQPLGLVWELLGGSLQLPHPVQPFHKHFTCLQPRATRMTWGR